MARRRKSSPRRRSRSQSLINLAESYAYADTLTSGVMGTSPIGFFTGAADIGYKTPSVGAGLMQASPVMVGAEAISLADITTSPGQSFNVMQSNFQANYMNMFYRAAAINVGFKLGKRLLRRPISNVNRNIFKPLGAGFKL
jgi:hypothetical protein